MLYVGHFDRSSGEAYAYSGKVQLRFFHFGQGSRLIVTSTSSIGSERRVDRIYIGVC